MDRQVIGFQGRTNKVADSCYSFWIGATLAMLNVLQDSDVLGCKEFLLQHCQSHGPNGGFCKVPDTYPDLLHSFYSVCWLALVEHPQLKKLDPRLGIPTDRLPEHLINL